jgi:transposase-like protein/DNA-directed RNA polymerase subunit RPC12/RpoP
MESLTRFIESLKTLELNIFITNTNLEPLMINQYVPLHLEQLTKNPEINQYINSINQQLIILNELLSPIARSAKKETYTKHFDRTEPYANYIIDEPPIVKEGHYRQLTFEEIMVNSSKEIKPIKRQKPFDYKGDCIRCGAPNAYVYYHTKSQLRCKACESTFTISPTYHDEITHHCPHCDNKLMLKHVRADYSVLTCNNEVCTFYVNNKKLVKSGEADHLKVHIDSYKLRYYFRLFDFDLAEIKANQPLTINSKINLSKIHHSQYTLGLVLTYYVNYGLSSRKTSRILYEVHGIKLTHQTVRNYAEAAASITEALNESYPYELSKTITFDETYIKVKGKSNYVFFGSDTINKIITSYRIFKHRSTRNAVTTLYQTLNKFPAIPDQLNIVTDGNPIYNASQVFFQMNDINFDLYQVIGVKNKDDVSRKWRVYKQVEERLNRTYKQNYYGTNGYGSLRNANVYMSLYVSFYNFLRSHSALRYKTPIQLDTLEDDDLMPNKWLKLLAYSGGLFKPSVYTA